MDMTLQQYILNPMGKNNAVLNSIAGENIRKTYTEKFDALMVRENSKLEYHLYKDKKSNTYWAHIKVPSETVKNFYYDVVFKFYTDSKILSAGENLFRYYTNFYSNDPAFVFTYAHVFIKNNIFIKELTPKMSREAVKKSPKETNPGNNIGYVKAIYFAYLWMQNRKLNNVLKFETESKPLNIKQLLSSIEDADIKIKERQEQGSKVETVKKNHSNSNIRNITQDQNVSGTKLTFTKMTASVKNGSSTKSSKKIGFVKKK